MQHMEMKCENHPDLRWHCKAIAINRNGRYNGSRNIFFRDWDGEAFLKECDCPGSALIAVDILAVNVWHDGEAKKHD